MSVKNVIPVIGFCNRINAGVFDLHTSETAILSRNYAFAGTADSIATEDTSF